MEFTEKNKAGNSDPVLEWLEKTANTLDNILNDDVEEVFAAAGQNYKEVDEIYNNILHLQEKILKIHEERTQKSTKHHKTR